MSDEAKERNLSTEEQQRLISFFSLLIQIDRRERKTSTSQQRHHMKENLHEA